MFSSRKHHVHMVGIGGAGMSGIAEVLLNLGYPVSGSDLHEGEVTRRLAGLGARVHKGHAPDHVPPQADVVVISSAVGRDNPEVQAARARGVPVIPRAEMLAELMRLKYGIAVAGSHGKTTTTAMVSAVLAAAGLDPTVVIGGKLNAVGANAKLGAGELFVAEADESDGSFLKLSPTLAVVTNVDPEHLDHYGTFENLVGAFVDFVNKVPFYGMAVLCLDHEAVQSMLPRVEKRFVTYGLSTQCDFQANAIAYRGTETSFEVIRGRNRLGRVTLHMPGEHNVYNALAALAIASELEIPFATAAAALTKFDGVQRRFTIRGEARGIMVVDDYGHHPEEIKATLGAARAGFDRRIVAVFQPHRYTRTRDLMEEFSRAFYTADVVVVTDLYAAGESPIAGVDSKRLFEGIREHGHKEVYFVPRLDDVGPFLEGMCREGDIVITLGAGDVNQAGRELLRRLGAVAA